MITKNTKSNLVSIECDDLLPAAIVRIRSVGNNFRFNIKRQQNSHFFPSFANWFVTSGRQVEQLSVKARDSPMLEHRMTHAERCKRQQQQLGVRKKL